jgi:putative DNA primase/helicase
MTSKLKNILQFVKLGCAVFPVVEGGKKPAVTNGVHAAKKSLKLIEKHFTAHPRQNWAIATGQASQIIVLDIDGPEGQESFKKLIEANCPVSKTVIVRTPHGRHIYFKAPAYRVPNSASRIAPGIDVRGDGGYVVGPGSANPDGAYTIVHGPDEAEIAPAPEWLLKKIAEAAPAPEPLRVQQIAIADRNRAEAYAAAALGRELDRLRKAPLHQRNTTLNLCAFKLGQFLPYGLFDENRIAADLTAAASTTGLHESEIAPTIKSGFCAGRQSPRRIPFLKSDKRARSQPAAPPTASNDEVTQQLASLGENDTDNAQRFATRFGNKVIYTRGRGWMVFDGKRYLPDELKCIEHAKTTARFIGDEPQYLDDDRDRAARAKFSATSLSEGALHRMLNLAKSLLVVADSKLDADPWLFNTQAGTIDLRAGRLEKHDARDLLTKISPVAASFKAKCPLFKKFLHRITAGDSELMTFIQKCVGCTLTGITSEQVLFFAYGKSGKNGKSTLVNTIRDMMGDYGCHTPTETLVVKQYDNAIPADLARLAGARMVTAIEANFNRHLDEARIKGMTGGEPITARFLFGNYFEFVPEFKLWLVANDRPRVRSTDDAFWRRIRVIPLNVTVPPSERDPDLPAKLKAEWPGILAWAVRGCLKWRREGLAEPSAVKVATADWREAADHLTRFVREALILEPDGVTSASALHNQHKAWCARNGERALSLENLKNELPKLFDVRHRRRDGHSEWVGAKLRV